jgi:alpha-tubulin suppressor-like RCC1 family protein
MVNSARFFLLLIPALLLMAVLTACGGSNLATDAATVPATATTFYSHNLLFRNSTTLSTGYNAFGQLGTGNLASRTEPGPLASYYPFAGLATGGDHSAAFINNSTVRCWGFNGYGQLGNNTTTFSSVPVKAGDISGVRAVAAGAFHTLALKNDGTLWAWGLNDAGQLGADAITSSPVPKKIAAAPVNIVAIAANAKHSLALADGKVWAWGLNASGQLGIDQATFGTVPAPAVVAGLPVAGVSAIAAGGAFSYAVAKDGTLWSWGSNINGQLGNNTTVSSFRPVQVVKFDGSPLSGVIKAAAGIQHGLALLADGTVWAFGYNHFGQLGNNETPDSPYAKQVQQLSGVSEIRAFGSSSMAKANGIWFGWGDNTLGQLGLRQVGSIPLPQRVLGF